MAWFSFLKRKINTTEEPQMKKFLIVGLGNVGLEYENTRHNIGFSIVDALASKYEVSFQPTRFGAMAQIKIKGRLLMLLKPDTFMNLSGKAIMHWVKAQKIVPEHLLILTDDLHLPFGSIRLRTKGSHAGHNGLKSIEQELNSSAYNRLRFGIGAPFNPNHQVDFVLGTWSEEEASQLPERLGQCVALTEAFALQGVQRTMNQFNGN
jgi:PTH1 family peptidyl-tRNA hydrolase